MYFFLSRYTEDIYYGQCECLHCSDIKSDKCLKRDILCMNNELKSIRIRICNNYIRLLMNNKMNESKSKMYHDSKYFYDDIIEDIVENVSGFKLKYSFNRTNIADKTLSNRIIRIPVCDRPFFSASISLFDAIKLTIDNCEKSYFSHFKSITDIIIYELENYLKEIKSYAKYKKQVLEIESSLKRLKKDFFYKGEQISNEYITIMTNLLTLTSSRDKSVILN